MIHREYIHRAVAARRIPFRSLATTLLAVATLTACQTHLSEGNSNQMQDNAPLTLTASLQGINGVGKVTRATTLTPAQTLCDGELSNLSTLFLEDKIRTLFICPALKETEISSLGGSLEAGGSFTFYKDYLLSTPIDAFTPRRIDVLPNLTQKAWIMIMSLPDNTSFLSDVAIGETVRNGSTYSFGTLQHQSAKISVLLYDKDGNNLDSKYFNQTNESDNLMIDLVYKYGFDTTPLILLQTSETDIEYVHLEKALKNPSAITQISSMKVSYSSNSIPNIAKYSLSRPAQLYANDGNSYMPNLYNLLTNQYTLSGKIEECYTYEYDDFGTYTKVENPSYTEDAYLLITLPAALSNTGLKETFKLYCKDIKLTNTTADGRTALTKLLAGEHAIINVHIDPRASLKAFATIGDWYTATADTEYEFGNENTDDAFISSHE